MEISQDCHHGNFLFFSFMHRNARLSSLTEGERLVWEIRALDRALDLLVSLIT